MAKRVVLFVHGWSVRNTDTYGGFPARLRSEARKHTDLDLDVRNIWLGKYISFHNEVRLPDISRAFNAALHKELGDVLRARQRIICVTHSTGGPVVRDWLHRFYISKGRKRSPVSHLIMLAPANFGSALAQLGKSRIGRLRTWFQGVEPGLGVLEWLELGSPQSWKLNTHWLENAEQMIGRAGVYSFVLTGVNINRKVYDHVNAYTGEMGSDGVVRAAAANLNCAYVKVVQRRQPDGNAQMLGFNVVEHKEVTQVPMAIIKGRAHSGDDMGIMRSVRNDKQPHPTLDALLKCIDVKTKRDYRRLAEEFAGQNEIIAREQQVEVLDFAGGFNRPVIHDPCAMVIFRVRNDQGNPVPDFELILTGENDNPDGLPPGFLIDRQKNHYDAGTLSFYFNYACMAGAPAVTHAGNIIRPALPGCRQLGLRVIAYPKDGFVHYVPGFLKASAANLKKFIKPNQTTLVDIVLSRFVREGVFRLSRKLQSDDFTKDPPGEPI